jgi:hypothetical protein
LKGGVAGKAQMEITPCKGNLAWYCPKAGERKARELYAAAGTGDLEEIRRQAGEQTEACVLAVALYYAAEAGREEAVKELSARAEERGRKHLKSALRTLGRASGGAEEMLRKEGLGRVKRPSGGNKGKRGLVGLTWEEVGEAVQDALEAGDEELLAGIGTTQVVLCKAWDRERMTGLLRGGIKKELEGLLRAAEEESESKEPVSKEGWYDKESPRSWYVWKMAGVFVQRVGIWACEADNWEVARRCIGGRASRPDERKELAMGVREKTLGEKAIEALARREGRAPAAERRELLGELLDELVRPGGGLEGRRKEAERWAVVTCAEEGANQAARELYAREGAPPQPGFYERLVRRRSQGVGFAEWLRAKYLGRLEPRDERALEAARRRADARARAASLEGFRRAAKEGDAEGVAKDFAAPSRLERLCEAAKALKGGRPKVAEALLELEEEDPKGGEEEAEWKENGWWKTAGPWLMVWEAALAGPPEILERVWGLKPREKGDELYPERGAKLAKLAVEAGSLEGAELVGAERALEAAELTQAAFRSQRPKMIEWAVERGARTRGGAREGVLQIGRAETRAELVEAYLRAVNKKEPEEEARRTLRAAVTEALRLALNGNERGVSPTPQEREWPGAQWIRARWLAKLAAPGGGEGKGKRELRTKIEATEWVDARALRPAWVEAVARGAARRAARRAAEAERRREAEAAEKGGRAKRARGGA